MRPRINVFCPVFFLVIFDWKLMASGYRILDCERFLSESGHV